MKEHPLASRPHMPGYGVRDKEEGLLQELNQLYQQKYGVSMLGGGLIYRLQARKVFAWLEPDFPNTASRWHFD